jgi:hypothetical protein
VGEGGGDRRCAVYSGGSEQGGGLGGLSIACGEGSERVARFVVRASGHERSSGGRRLGWRLPRLAGLAGWSAAQRHD